MLSFCLFKDQLHIASKNQSKIVTLERDDEIAQYLFDERPDRVITLAGPYPFTRLRIVLSTAEGFAMGHNIEYHFIKTFDFLNYLFPGHLITLETRRGDFFTFHQELGERLMTQAEIDTHSYLLITDNTKWPFNMAEKLIEFYPQAKTFKDPHYFYTPEYSRNKIY